MTDDLALLKAYRTAFFPDTKVLVLTDICEWCNGFGTTFNPDSEYITGFQEGRRDVYLHILQNLGIEDLVKINRALGTIPVEFKEPQKEAEKELE